MNSKDALLGRQNGLRLEAGSDDKNPTGNGSLNGPGTGSWILVKRVKNRRNDAITSRGNHSRNFISQSKNFSIVIHKQSHTYNDTVPLILFDPPWCTPKLFPMFPE